MRRWSGKGTRKVADLVFIKTAGGTLAPADIGTAEYIDKVKVGATLAAAVTKQRNPKFHRKYLALLNLAFDSWEPELKTYRGEKAGKNFDQFRKQVAILAGYYEASYTITGEVRLIAKSISFAKMDEDEFEKLYSASVNVILQRILTNYTRDNLDAVVEKLLSFT